MKTTRFLNMMAASLVGVAFMSCSSQDDVLTPAGQTYTMSVTAQKGGDETRALNLDGNTLNATWTEGDVVKVYNSASTELGELTAQTAGKSTTLSGTLTTLPENGATLTLKYLSPSYSQQDGTLTGADNSIDKVCDYATATVTATVSGTNVTTGAAEFQNQQAVVKFTLEDKANTSTKLSPTALTINDGTSDIVTLTSIPGATYTSNGEGVLYVAIPGFSDQTVTLTATVGTDTYTCTTSEAKTLENGKYYGVTAQMTKQAAAPAGAEAVDLGLSVKWANMNVGATSEGDYGQFFAWGETTGYGSNTADGHKFGWPSYSLCGGSNTTLTKYNNDGNKGTVDNKTTLEAADDAATANWGGDWRMPTYDELNELLATKTNANYTWTWTTVGGHNGYKITNNTTGANIFLPASGGRYDTTLGSQGTYGNYWSSSLNVSNARYGHYLSFEPNSASMVYTFRHSGFSVRPVQGAAAPAGALSGEFSVSATKKVKFSQGNLRATYNGSSWTWSFATNQYDYIGNAEGNTKVSGSDPFVTGYTGSSTTVDLFGWSTSTTYLGINNSTNNNTYSGDSSNPGIFVDWGSHADVIAGIGSGWFTLSGAEWAYLFGMESKNKDKSGHARYRKYFRAQVNGVSGIVFLPDDISGISNIPAESSRGTASTFSGKTYTTDAWSALESAGCVFLPAAGGRNGSTVSNAGTLGCYWSATPYNAGQTYYVGIYSNTLYPGSTSYSTLEYGNSVRLVREVE